MLRSPRPQTTRTTIHTLSNEILINIVASFTHFYRNGDLAALALVNKRFRPIAQEWLLKAPRFSLTHIDKYLWELGHHAHLLPQIRVLEIHSASDNRIQKDERGMPKREYTPVPRPVEPPWSEKFVEKCEEVIRCSGKDEKNVRRWSKCLEEDCIPALLGILLCTLPNLEELLLGDTWLMDMPIFASMCSPDVYASGLGPREWRHGYLKDVLDTLAPRLRVLEVPTDMSSLWFSHRTGTVWDFRRFENLKDVGLTMRALWWSPRRGRTPPDPREVFGPRVEVLRITEATLFTSSFLNMLCTAKKGGHYPRLRRVELYYMEPRKEVEGMACLFRTTCPVEGVQRMFREAEIEIYVYFPEWALRTWEVGSVPWRLRDEKGLFEQAQWRAYKKVTGPFGLLDDFYDVFEAEWDADGDAVMLS